MFSLRTDLLMAVAEARSNEETRYYLNGVFVTPRIDEKTGYGALMVATDGHMMLVGYDRWGNAPRDAILSLDFKAKSLKKIGREIGFRRLIVEEISPSRPAVAEVWSGQVKAALKSRETDVEYLLAREIPGDFPDWRCVVPSPAAESSGGADYGWGSSLMSRTTKAFKTLGAIGQHLSFNQNSPNDPALVQHPDARDELLAVLMPLRIDLMNKASRPDWIEKPVALAAE